jgi:hypothetical protein
MHNIGELALEIAKGIQAEAPKRGKPPDEGLAPQSQQVLPHSIVKNTRGYIEAVVRQINGCYENGWFDACSVMIRRLMETLIIEVFEKHNISERIKNRSDDFMFLGELIDKTLAEISWNLTRNTKSALPKLKDVGDKSAHSRRFIAHRRDIDKIIDELRVAVQELIYLSGLK